LIYFHRIHPSLLLFFPFSLHLIRFNPTFFFSILEGVLADFQFSSLQSGPGAQVDIDVKSGLTPQVAVFPAAGYEYHVHVNPVGPGHDCMATGGHLDPANVGASIKCTTNTPAEKCQEGDLSGKQRSGPGRLNATITKTNIKFCPPSSLGKHGNITAAADGKSKKISYIDHQLQFTGATTTIVGRSVVIHNNGARMACADILPLGVTSEPTEKGDSANPASTPTTTELAQTKAIQSQPNAAQGGRQWIGWGKATTAVAVVTTGIVGLLSAL